jgi:hypothetical protein
LRATLWAGSAAAAAAAALVIVAAAAVMLTRGPIPPPPAAPTTAAALPQASATATKPTMPALAPPSFDPSFDIVSVAPDGQAVIAGRAMPGDHVTVLDGGAAIGEVTADARGEWVLLPAKSLAPGNRQLALAASGPDGGPPRHSPDIVALTVTPPAGTGAAGATALAVLLPGEPGRPAHILQQSPAPPGQALTLDSVEYGEGGRLTLSGHADPGASLQIYAGDRLLGTATADNASGEWTLVAPRPAGAAGEIALRVAETAARGGAVAGQIAAPLAPPGSGAAYVVVRGNSLWRIARRIYGNGQRYTAIYRANRGQIRHPDLIFPGQHFAVPKS